MARSSMPSSVQHGSTSPRATSVGAVPPAVVDRLEVELGDERRLPGPATGRPRRGDGCGGRRGDRGPAAGRGRPTAAGGPGVGDHDQPVDVEVGGPAEPLGHRVRRAPSSPALRHSAAAASSSSALAAASRSQAPSSARTGLDERRRGGRGRPRRAGRAGRRRPPRAPARPAGRTRCASSLSSMFMTPPAAIRASRIRCISMLPDATVADTE